MRYLVLLAILLIGGQPFDVRRVSTVLPNIVVVLTDDQPANTLVYMPRVQALGGTTFTNAYTVTPLCTPARATMLTGQYTHNHKAYCNSGPNGGYTAFDPSVTIATVLQSAGYTTGLIGKYLNNYLPEYAHEIPPGWSTWFAMTDSEPGYFNWAVSDQGINREYSSYSTDVLRDKAVAFVRATAGSPFLLVVGVHSPHAPYTPPSRYAGLHTDTAISRPLSFNEADVSDKAGWVNRLPLLSGAAIANLDKQARKQLEANLAVDELIGRVYDELVAQGIADNTIIIVLSDNGLALGEHRWALRKNCPYNSCLHIPLWVLCPVALCPAQHTTVTYLISNIDIGPTVADLAGITLPNADGYSFAPLLRGETYTPNAEMLIEHDIAQDGVPDYTGLLTSEWKYIRLTRTGFVELYDLVNDPDELTNVAGLYPERVIEFALRVQDLRDD